MTEENPFSFSHSVNATISPSPHCLRELDHSFPTRCFSPVSEVKKSDESPIGLPSAKPVSSKLDDDTGRWLLEGEGDAELALTGVVDGARVSIVIDRVLVDADGVHWIVDYKTSSHEGGDLDGFLASEARRYRPQLEKYATVYAAYAGASPRCALYFPLLGRFVEVPPLQ